MISERLLQFLWQMQYYNREALSIDTGESLQIIQPGFINSNQGPDFLNARIKIDGTEWVGHVELHTRSALWKVHGHDEDPNYQNVILHVVWEHDSENSTLPLLVLENRVPKWILHRYEEWMSTRHSIPCHNFLNDVAHLVWTSWKDRLLVERLLRKSSLLCIWLEETRGNWEEAFWWLIARNFGIKVNEEAFEELARSLPLNLLTRHKSQLLQLEAILLGQGGLLEKNFLETYPNHLQREYRFYQTKYSLQPIRQSLHFLRMRPGNFPTIRLAQLAALIHRSTHLFSKIKEAVQLSDVKAMLELEASEYWQRHYVFDDLAEHKTRKLGREMIANLLINSIIPSLFTYGHLHHEEQFMARAIDWLRLLEPEHNATLKNWEALHVPCENAFDSQALLELRVHYCDKKRCLDCAIGNSHFKRSQLKGSC